MDESQLKILFLGNQGNQGYRYCKWLRLKGYKADLVFDYKNNHARSLPEWEDPSLKNNYPNWISNFDHRFWHFFKRSRRLEKIISKYDIIITCGKHIIVSLNYDKPVVVKPVGGDITQLPFNAGSLRFELMSYFYRKNSHKINAVVAVQEDIHWACKFLSVRSFHYNPIPVEIKAIQKNIDSEYLRALKNRYSQKKLVIFHPTRKNLKKSRKDFKGNDIFLNGLKQFIDNYNIKSGVDVKVVIGMHGKDVDDFKNLIETLNFPTNLIDYVEQIPLPKLHAFMTLPNAITVDQFGEVARVSLGGISREAMSIGCPLITGTDITDDIFISAYGKNAPIMSSFNEFDICENLSIIYEKIAKDSEALNILREDIIAWSSKYLDWEKVIDDFISILHKIQN